MGVKNWNYASHFLVYPIIIHMRSIKNWNYVSGPGFTGPGFKNRELGTGKTVRESGTGAVVFSCGPVEKLFTMTGGNGNTFVYS